MANLNKFLNHLIQWAAAEREITGIFLAGSYARDNHKLSSDVDLVIICETPTPYLINTNWVSQFGTVDSYQIEKYGQLTAVRVYYRDGFEIEFGITSKNWIQTPADSGSRQVVNNGIKIIHDPLHELKNFLDYVNRTNPAIHPMDYQKMTIAHYTSCLILTHDNKLLLQQRGEQWQNFPGYLCTFGGAVEAGENADDAIIRELHEELGAALTKKEIIPIGAYTEAITEHKEVVMGYFWHDKHQKITGCYEGTPFILPSPYDLSNFPLVMDDLSWLLQQCKQLRLLAK